MLALLDLQQRFAHAMTSGDGRALEALLLGGQDPAARLAIHLRHYAASLVSALCDKFPASAWLIGGAVVGDAAAAFVRRHPPRQPCIAEYGRDFPQFLAGQPRTAQLPYLASFAELEWAIGRASIAVDMPALSWNQLTTRRAERLVDSTLTLQPGLYYVRSDWRIDELMRTYLGGSAPERFVLTEDCAPIEVRGARGMFDLERLDAATFAFRAALAAGRTIGDAAATALALDATFDAGKALRALVDARLAIGGSLNEQESHS